jgi:hypothetical protein
MDFKVAALPGPGSGFTVLDLPQQSIFQSREQVIRIPRCGARGQLTTTNNTTVYTAPSMTNNPTGATIATSYLTSLVLSNFDSSARTITAYMVESGGSAATNRLILPTVSLAANTVATFTYGSQGCPMESGETLILDAGTADTIAYRVNVEELAF